MTYIYSGPIKSFEQVLDSNAILFTNAKNLHTAIENLRWQAARKVKSRWPRLTIDKSKVKEYDPKTNLDYIPKESKQELDDLLDVEVEEKPMCDNCGIPLTDNGQCPICDLGEEEYESCTQMVHNNHKLEEALIQESMKQTNARLLLQTFLGTTDIKDTTYQFGIISPDTNDRDISDYIDSYDEALTKLDALNYLEAKGVWMYEGKKYQEESRVVNDIDVNLLKQLGLGLCQDAVIHLVFDVKDGVVTLHASMYEHGIKNQYKSYDNTKNTDEVVVSEGIVAWDSWTELKDGFKFAFGFYNKLNLTEDLTQAQKNYFKNSKVRDEKGNLLICYHGTKTPGFNEFNHEGKNTQFGNYKFGKYNVNYFTSSKRVAQGYTEIGIERDNNIYYCYLNIENPYIVNNKSESDVKAWMNIQDKNIANKKIEYFKKFWNKWSPVHASLEDEDVKDINKDLYYLGYELKSSNERPDSDQSNYGRDDEWYDLWALGDNTMFGKEHIEEYSYTLDELFDNDMYELWRDHIIGNEEDQENLMVTTNDIVKFVLLMNEEEGTNYDGIIVPNIHDVGPTGDPFGEGSNTDYITLKSANQIKRIDNLNPTNSSRIDESNIDKTTNGCYNKSSMNLDLKKHQTRPLTESEYRELYVVEDTQHQNAPEYEGVLEMLFEDGYLDESDPLFSKD